MSSIATPFESTIHKTNIWLNDLMEELGWPDRNAAYHALRVVLHVLRDHLTVEQAAALGAQLPMLVRGFYYEGWHPHGKPVKQRKKEEFLAHVVAKFGDSAAIDAEMVTQAVFKMLSRHVTKGEIEQLKHSLPAGIRVLWCEEPRTIWS